MDKDRPQRRARHNVRLDAMATRADGTQVRAIVTDLSFDGCCMIGRFRAGERLIMSIAGIGIVTADVRWAAMSRAGARFLTGPARILDSRGVAAIEYAILAGLIALALVVAITRLGGGVESNFNDVDQAVGTGMEFSI